MVEAVPFEIFVRSKENLQKGGVSMFEALLKIVEADYSDFKESKAVDFAAALIGVLFEILCKRLDIPTAFAILNIIGKDIYQFAKDYQNTRKICYMFGISDNEFLVVSWNKEIFSIKTGNKIDRKTQPENLEGISYNLNILAELVLRNEFKRFN